MQVFHRLKRTLSVSIESLLDQVENQEAVVTATIREVEEGAARVRFHRKGCERRIDALSKRALELDGEARLWRERARRMAGEREQALECVRRLRAATAERREVTVELEKHRETLVGIRDDDRAIDEKLGELRRRRAQLVSRQTRTEVESGPHLDEVDEVLDRWEARLERREAVCETSACGTDAFARALTAEEEAAEVSAELDRLLAEREES